MIALAINLSEPAEPIETSFTKGQEWRRFPRQSCSFQKLLRTLGNTAPCQSVHREAAKLVARSFPGSLKIGSVHRCPPFSGTVPEPPNDRNGSFAAGPLTT